MWQPPPRYNPIYFHCERYPLHRRNRKRCRAPPAAAHLQVQTGGNARLFVHPRDMSGFVQKHRGMVADIISRFVTLVNCKNGGFRLSAPRFVKGAGVSPSLRRHLYYTTGQSGKHGKSGEENPQKWIHMESRSSFRSRSTARRSMRLICTWLTPTTWAARCWVYPL